LGDQIEKNETGGACSRYGGEERCILGKRPLGDTDIDGRIVVR
jgi:hypothetical protein